MSKPAHTPGPWLAAARPTSVVGWPVVAPKTMGGLICNVTAGHAESEANANLIAASPLYHEAAEAFLDYEQASEKGDGVAMMLAYDKFSGLLKQAHAKANGETK